MLDAVSSPRRAGIAKAVATSLAPGQSTYDLDPNADLRELGMTSLSMVNLMLSVEGEFGLTIPKHELHPDNFKSIAAIDAMLSRLANDDA